MTPHPLEPAMSEREPQTAHRQDEGTLAGAPLPGWVLAPDGSWVRTGQAAWLPDRGRRPAAGRRPLLVGAVALVGAALLVLGATSVLGAGAPGQRSSETVGALGAVAGSGARDGGSARPVAGAPDAAADLVCDLAAVSCTFPPADYACEGKDDGATCTHLRDSSAAVELKAKDDGTLQVKLRSADRLACSGDDAALRCRYLGASEPASSEVLDATAFSCLTRPGGLACTVPPTTTDIVCEEEGDELSCRSASGAKAELKVKDGGRVDLSYDARAFACGHAADGALGCRPARAS